jgi:uncharacterized protein (DUF58 family)
LIGLALAVAVAAFITGKVPLIRLAYVLWAVILVAAAVTWSAIRWLEIDRHTRARRAQVGGLAEETFSVRNAGWLPKLWIEIRDLSDLPGHRASHVIATLSPGRMRTWRVRTRCRRRGAFTLGPVVVTGGDPLGLFRLEREIPRTAPFIVYPATVPIPQLDLPSGYLSGGVQVRRRAQYATTSVRGVRQYLPGDAYNRIHWPTTARRGRLYTKEFELDPFADFWLLLDLDRSVHVGELFDEDGDEGILQLLSDDDLELDPTTEEHAVTAAASLAQRSIDMGRSVGLIAHGQRRVVTQPDRGERQLRKLLANLAVLRARGRAGLSEVLAAESHQFTRHTTLIVVTPTTALSWVNHLRELRFRGVASMVVSVQANTFGPAASNQGLLGALRAHSIPARNLAYGDDVGVALSGENDRPRTGNGHN